MVRFALFGVEDKSVAFFKESNLVIFIKIESAPGLRAGSSTSQHLSYKYIQTRERERERTVIASREMMGKQMEKTRIDHIHCCIP